MVRRDFLLVLVLILRLESAVESANTYKICVPKKWLSDCERMTNEPTKASANIACVPARDRIECLNFIQQRHADFIAVEPEEMYIATKIPNEDFYVFQEIRTILEPEAAYRYQAIMLIKNSLNITSLEGLRGLKSCHTGVNRNVGYKIPLTMLSKRGIIGLTDDLSLTPKENELKAFSRLFEKSCIVGKWSPDPKTNEALKRRYSNLCAMCEDPAKCDYPDNFSGYDGSIRCLAQNNGDVAFTKMIYVKMFFGMQVGTTIPAKETGENPDLYSYLCADGTRVSVREKPCSWAARPWPAFMGHQDIIGSVDPLREKLKELGAIGSKRANETWFEKVLGFVGDVHSLYDNSPVTPGSFLKDSNYTDVIERGDGNSEQTVRLCVTSDVAYKKCETLSIMAYGIDIRPQIVCVQHNSDYDCLEMVKDNKADAASIPGIQIIPFMQNNITPLFSETYRYENTQYAVAVVKKSSDIQNWNDLKNKRSCHSSFNSVEGFIAPIYGLISNGLIDKNNCNRIKQLAQFFSSGSCVPDLPVTTEQNDKSLLTQQCVENSENDAMKCLSDDNGDVAFVSNIDLYTGFDKSAYELLCLNSPEGGRRPLSDWKTCNIIQTPPRSWLGVASRSRRPSDSVTHVMLTISEELTVYRIDLFNMFGEFLDHNDVMFSGSATGLVASDQKWFGDFKNIYNEVMC